MTLPPVPPELFNALEQFAKQEFYVGRDGVGPFPDRTMDSVLFMIQQALAAEGEQLRADLKAAQSRIEEEDRNYVAMMELRDQAERQVGQLRADLAAAKDAAQQLEDALLDAIIQGAGWDAATGVLDSCALRAFAEGMELLAERGRLTIEKYVGRRVIVRINRKAEPPK